MIEQDTVKLLRECDAGIQMGISAIDEVLEYTKGKHFRQLLRDCKREHQELASELQGLLHRYQDEGKDPNPMAKGMSRLKTNVKIGLDESDKTVADLITDGCNMGVKSLNRYLNQYEAADEVSKDIAKRLIHLEEQLATNIRCFL